MLLVKRFTIFICTVILCGRSLHAHTTSVVIPCHSKHARYLPDLIRSFEKQSVLPDELVIALSDTSNVPSEIIKEIQTTAWSFNVELILSINQKSEAQNRNLACSRAKGDIIIGQDADDCPHPQRIEIIKFFFERYPIVHLLHSAVDDINDCKIYENFEEIKWVHVDELGMMFGLGYPIVNGPASFKKYVFEKVKYDESCGLGVDIRFNDAVYSLYRDTMMIPAAIYVYNWALSTYPRSEMIFDRTRCRWIDG